MRAVVTLFLLLCCQFLASTTSVNASSYSQHSSVTNSAAVLSYESITANRAYLLSESISLTEDNAYSEGADDDDENEDLIRKSVPKRYFVAFIHAFITNYYYNKTASN